MKPKFIIVYGVATNVCVNFAVMGLVERGYIVTVIIDAIKELPNLSVDDIIEKWVNRGINIITTERLEIILGELYEKF